MRSSLLCTHSILTHSSACHCTPMAQLKARWDEPNERLMHFYQTLGLYKAMNLKSIKTPEWKLHSGFHLTCQNTPLLGWAERLQRAQPIMTGHFPVLVSASTTCKPDVVSLCIVASFFWFREKIVYWSTWARTIFQPSLCLSVGQALDSTKYRFSHQLDDYFLINKKFINDLNNILII